MKPEVLDQYADGRVFTGSQAVKLGFADSVGTWDDARRTLGQMTGLGDNPEVFKVKKAVHAFGVLRSVVNFGPQTSRPSFETFFRPS